MKMANLISKITVKSIPHYPEISIKEAACDVNSTWEEFFNRFGINLANIAPNDKFVVKSRKGTSFLNEQVDIIASKYVQKFRILVTVEPYIIKLKKKSSRILHTVPLRMIPPISTVLSDIQTLPPLKRPVSKTLKSKPSTVAEQLMILNRMKIHFREALLARKKMAGTTTLPVVEIPSLHTERPLLPSPFPPFSSILNTPSVNFETRVEKIEDYNVIQRSSIVWQNTQEPVLTMRCFSMSDDDFIL